jgi:hypothetical protein
MKGSVDNGSRQAPGLTPRENLAERDKMTLKQKAKDMRHAIDMIEGAMMGLGTDIPTGSDFLRQAELWEMASDDLIITPHMTVGQLRRVVSATTELTRIINSDEYVIN